MSYNLFLDDSRKPNDVKWVDLPLVHWEIVTKYEDFVKIILDKGLPNIISFDHDVATEHYKEYKNAHSDLLIGERRIRYEIFKEKTGYDCAKFLAEYCVCKKLPIPLYYIHTLNGIGGANIFSVLESARKILNGT